MCVYMYIYVHVSYINIYIYLFIHTNIYIFDINKHPHIHAHIHTYKLKCFYPQIYPYYVLRGCKGRGDELLLHMLSLKLWRDIETEISSRQLMKDLSWANLGYNPTCKN